MADSGSLAAFGGSPRLRRPDGLGSAQESTPLGQPPSIPGFVVRRVAGMGGLGVVYEARQVHPDRNVAIKIVRPELLADGRWRDAVLRRFEREVRHASRLHHPYILPVYEAGVFGDDGDRQPYLAMELLTAESILDWANTHGLGQATRIELLAKVAEAVHYAHLNGVVHRDLKPSNVVVRPSGLPAVRDFSLAWALEQDAILASRHAALTEPGTIACTYEYAAPEQLRGQKTGPGVDVYALGVLGYELLTGAFPYEGERRDLPGLITSVMEGRIVPIRRRDPSVGPDLAAVVHKALATECGQRYPSAEAMADDLRRAMRGERPEAKRATLLDDMRRFARRHRRVLWSGVAVVGALAVGLVTAARQAAETRRQLEVVAEQNRQFGKLAGDLAVELATALEGMPLGVTWRGTILERSVAALNRMIATGGDVPPLRQALVAALIDLGQSTGDPTRPSDGDRVLAARYLQQAIDLLEAPDAQWEDPRAWNDLRGRAHLVLGRVRMVDDRLSAAPMFRTAHEAYAELVAAEPVRGVACGNMTYTLKLWAEHAPASERTALLAAMARAEELVDRSMSTPAAVVQEANLDFQALSSLAEAACALGLADEVDRSLDRAVAALAPLAAPDDTASMALLVNTKRYRARAAALRGDAAGEEAWMRQACRELADRFVPGMGGVMLQIVGCKTFEEYTRMALARRLSDADWATANLLAFTRDRWEWDPSDDGNRARFAEGIRRRIEWLGTDGAGRDEELAGLRAELASVTADRQGR